MKWGQCCRRVESNVLFRVAMLPQVQSLGEEIFSRQPFVWTDYPEVSLAQTESALMYDGVQLLARGLHEQLSRDVNFNVKPLSCAKEKTSDYGLETLNYMKTVGVLDLSHKSQSNIWIKHLNGKSRSNISIKHLNQNISIKHLNQTFQWNISIEHRIIWWWMLETILVIFFTEF